MDANETASRQALIQVLTTEHFTLQGARAVAISEVSARASIYLSAVSSAVVALALVTSLAQTEEMIRAFALVLLPIVAFMGFVTKARLIQLSRTDFHYQRAINRVRHAYVDVAPESAHYFLLSIHDDVPGVVESSVFQRGRRMGMLTAAQMIGVVNYVIVGLAVGIVIDWLAGAPAWLSIVVGIVVGLAVALWDFRREEAQWRQYVATFDVLFPSPGEAEERRAS